MPSKRFLSVVGNTIAAGSEKFGRIRNDTSIVPTLAFSIVHYEHIVCVINTQSLTFSFLVRFFSFGSCRKFCIFLYIKHDIPSCFSLKILKLSTVLKLL